MEWNRKNALAGGRRSFLIGGLAVGAGILAGGATGFGTAGPASASATVSGDWLFRKGNTVLTCQSGWRICITCASMVWSPDMDGPYGCIDAGFVGNHTFAATYNYLMPYWLQGDGLIYSQNNWHHCANCGAFYYAGTGTGACWVRQGIGHEPGASFNYLLMYNNEARGGNLDYQDGWAYCDSCHILFYGQRTATSRCAGGYYYDPNRRHGPNYTWNYDALFTP
jgi:hypothetical protein